jgi:endonuclease IV
VARQVDFGNQLCKEIDMEFCIDICHAFKVFEYRQNVSSLNQSDEMINEMSADV